jgi:hypothetical protein
MLASAAAPFLNDEPTLMRVGLSAGRMGPAISTSAPFRQEKHTMDETPISRHEANRKLRNELIDSIHFRIEWEVNDAFPSELSEETRKAVLGQILPESRRTLEALTIEELQNECSLARFIDSTIANSNYLLHQIPTKRRQS